MSTDMPATVEPVYMPPKLLEELRSKKVRELIDDQVEARISDHVRSRLDEHGSRSFITRNPGAALTIIGAALVFGQWAVTRWLHESQEPERKKAKEEISEIRKDIRTLGRFQLESHRYTREFIKDIARAQGMHPEEPPRALRSAETAVRKLQDK